MRTPPLFLIVCLCVWGWSACAVTDTGNPPAAPFVDPDRVESDGSSIGETQLRGRPGAVFPAEGVVIFTPFGEDRALRASVAADGSFSTVLSFSAVSDVVRLQVVQGGLRSNPVDIDPDGEVRPALSCLSIDKWTEAALDETGESVFFVEASNDCEDTVVFDAPQMRLSDGPLTLTSSEIAPLAAGAVATLTFRVTRDAAGEDILFLPVSAPIDDRRAITLVVQDL